MRYAHIHRTLENGIATDRTWSELLTVCIELGKNDEAVEALDRITNPSQRARARSILVRHGLIDSDSGKQDRKALQITEADMNPSVREEILDSLRFLFEDHMPLTVIVATMTFPIVVGLGGFLTAGSSFFLLPAIALIPALTVLGLVGALGRRILLEASKGLEDPPAIPETKTLAREAVRFILDGAALTAVFLGPGIALMMVPGFGTGAPVAALLVGGLMLPMAMAIRQVTDDWRAVYPNRLLPAIVRCGTRYLSLAGVTVLLFVPAAIAVYLTRGSQLYLVISVIGPLSVTPLFICSRLMGQLFHYQRKELADLIDLPGLQCARFRSADHPAAKATRAAPAARHGEPEAAARRRTPLGAPSHPEAKPKLRRWRKKAPRQKAPLPKQRDNRARRSGRPSPGSSPIADEPPPFFGAPAGGATSRRRMTPAMVGSDQVGDAVPDLTKMPGFRVVSGEQRDRAGAASNSRRPRPPRR